MIGNIRRSPRFIKAKNEGELQKAILAMQIKLGKEYCFLSIYPVKDGVIAWYYDAAETFNEIMRVLKNGAA